MEVLQTKIKLKTDKLKTIQDQFGFMESGLLKQKDRYACGLLTNQRDMLGNTLQEQDQGQVSLQDFMYLFYENIWIKARDGLHG